MGTSLDANEGHENRGVLGDSLYNIKHESSGILDNSLDPKQEHESNGYFGPYSKVAVKLLY